MKPSTPHSLFCSRRLLGHQARRSATGLASAATLIGLVALSGCQAREAKVEKTRFQLGAGVPQFAPQNYHLTQNTVFFWKKAPDDVQAAGAEVKSVLDSADAMNAVNEKAITALKKIHALNREMSQYCEDGDCTDRIDAKNQAETRIDRAPESIAKSQEKLANEQAKRPAAQRALDEATAALAELNQQIDAKKSKLAELEAANPATPEIEAQKVALKAEIENLESVDRPAAETRVATAKTALDKVDTAVKKAETEIATKQKKLEDDRALVAQTYADLPPLAELETTEAEHKYFTGPAMQSALVNLQSQVVVVNDTLAALGSVDLTFADGAPDVTIKDWGLTPGHAVQPLVTRTPQVGEAYIGVNPCAAPGTRAVTYEPQAGTFAFTVLAQVPSDPEWKMNNPLTNVRYEFRVARVKNELTQLDGRIYFAGEVKLYATDGCATAGAGERLLSVGYVQLGDFSSLDETPATAANP